MNVLELKNLKKIWAFDGNFAVFDTKDGKTGIINRNGEVVLPADNWEVASHIVDDIYILQMCDGSSKQTYYDAALRKEVAKPELPITPEPELPKNAEFWCAPNRCAFKDGELFGIMDEKGNVIVPATFSSVGIANNPKRDQISVKDQNGLNGYLDLDGKVIIPFEHPYVGYQVELGVHIFHTKENKWGYMDAKGNVIIPAIYDHISAHKAYGLDEIAVAKDGRFYFINAKQEEVKVF
jgi:hypothetical protein